MCHIPVCSQLALKKKYHGRGERGGEAAPVMVPDKHSQGGNQEGKHALPGHRNASNPTLSLGNKSATPPHYSVIPQHALAMIS